MPILQRNKTPVLSQRLLAVAEAVPSGSVFADIGTDHALVPVYLIKTGACKEGVASDIRKGPLERAKQNIDRHKCSECISTVLTDGLKGLPLEKTDVLIIAGMGGETIIRIIDESKSLIKRGTKLVIQPMTDLPTVRRYAYTNGLLVLSEKLVQDTNKLYTVLLAQKEETPPSYSLKEILIGRYSLKDPLYPCYLQNNIYKYTKMLSGLKRSSAQDMDRIHEIQSTLELFQIEAEKCKTFGTSFSR